MENKTFGPKKDSGLDFTVGMNHSAFYEDDTVEDYEDEVYNEINNKTEEEDHNDDYDEYDVYGDDREYEF